ncbi:MAG: DUF2510 domain-containing protein [Actinobacteria bacterium]|nr:DUF2510 domain-containing protein [Actinomycetota bacterium]
MHEYSTVILSNGSADALAAELTRKSAEGWEVVSIVTTFDGRYCAFVRRSTGAPATAASAQGVAGYGMAATGSSSAVSEPAAPTELADAGQPGQPLPPADWYADPSGRYELRYWNGSDWTEHVARKGKQFTDPPVP